MADLLQTMDRPNEAEPLRRRPPDIDATYHGADHPEVATDLGNSASCCLARAVSTKQSHVSVMRSPSTSRISGIDHPCSLQAGRSYVRT